MARKTITDKIFQEIHNDYINGYSIDDIVKKYGFKKNTIMMHFNKHNIYFTNAKRFTKEEIDAIVFDCQNGLKPYELAKKYNRDSATIITKLQSLGVYEYATHRFTDEEIEFLKIYYPIGDWDTIQRELPNISKQSIHTKMSSLGISMKSNHWTSDDEKILIDNYESMYGHIKELVDLFDGKYTYNSIISKACKLGLKTRNLWSKEEIDILTNNYSCKTLDEMLELLPLRNRNSIIHKANSLGLVNKIKLDYCFSESERDYIVNNYNNMTDREIAIKLNRSEHNISDFRSRNNLLKVYEKSSYNDLSEYVRRNNIEWKIQSMINCGYKCVLTGNRFDDIHHIYGLNLILNETLDELNIMIRESMDDYTDEELRDILEAFRIKQFEYPLGVCLCKDVHKLFHSIYGYGNNTQTQWDEFVDNFNNGKYNEYFNVA